MYWMLLAVSLLAPTTAPAFDPCSTIYERYQATMRQAQSGSKAEWGIQINYLKNIERAIKNCFSKPKGKALIKKRKALKWGVPQRRPPAQVLQPDNKKLLPKKSEREPTKADMVRALHALTDRVISLEQQSVTHAARSGSWRKPWRPHPGSAAFASFIMPGLGQALQNRPLAAWLWWIAIPGTYIVASSVLGAVLPKAKRLESINTTWTTFGVVMGIAFAAHIGCVIDAAVWKPKRWSR